MTGKHYWGFGKSARGALQGNPLSGASEDRGHWAAAPDLGSSASVLVSAPRQSLRTLLWKVSCFTKPPKPRASPWTRLISPIFPKLLSLPLLLEHSFTIFCPSELICISCTPADLPTLPSGDLTHSHGFHGHVTPDSCLGLCPRLSPMDFPRGLVWRPTPHTTTNPFPACLYSYGPWNLRIEGPPGASRAGVKCLRLNWGPLILEVWAKEDPLAKELRGEIGTAWVMGTRAGEDSRMGASTRSRVLGGHLYPQ